MNMFKLVWQQIKIGLLFIFFLTLITGVFYPLTVLGIAKIFFPWQADGSLIEKNGHLVGSTLIGQCFDTPKYFSGRPSMTSPFPNNAESSSGSNMATSNPIFLSVVQNRVNRFQQFKLNPTNMLVPVDLVTASGSGLDPDISLAAAYYQVSKIAKARQVPEEKIKALIVNLTKNRTFGILGEQRVNVLELNLALDNLRGDNGR